MSDEEDREIAAMRAVAEALESLSEAERVRVLHWADERYGSTGKFIETVTERAVELSLCDCAHPDAHDLDCAYLDVLMFQKVAAGDVVIVGEPS